MAKACALRGPRTRHLVETVYFVWPLDDELVPERCTVRCYGGDAS